MTKEFLYDFIQQHTLAVISTISQSGQPKSALIGFAVTENLEIVFDTVCTSRKYRNIVQNPNVALVIGWNNEQFVLILCFVSMEAHVWHRGDHRLVKFPFQPLLYDLHMQHTEEAATETKSKCL